MIIIALFIVTTVSINAQFYIEGNLGFGLTSSTTDNNGTSSRTTNNSFYLAPGIGTFLSEKVSLGLSLDLSFSGGTSGPDPDAKTKAASIGASPYVRYYALRWNKLAVYGQGNIGFRFSNSSETIDGTKTDGPKDSDYYLSVFPGLSYDVSDKLQLQTSLNFLRLGYVYSVSKEGSSEDRHSSFYGGATLDNIISFSAITIGAIYKF